MKKNNIKKRCKAFDFSRDIIKDQDGDYEVCLMCLRKQKEIVNG